MNQSKTDHEMHLATDQVAALLSVPAGTLARWRSEGAGPPFLKFQHTVRYGEAQLREWMKRHTQGGSVSNDP